MRQDWSLEFRLLKSALQVRDYVELSHRPQRPAKQPKKSEPVPVNPSWETVFRAAMQPMSRE